MPKGIFGLRACSKKELAAIDYTQIVSPESIQKATGSRQMNVLHEVHERGYPVYNFVNHRGHTKKKATTKFCLVDVDNPKPFTQCIKIDDNGLATMSHLDMIALGLPVVHLNLVEIALLPCTLFRASSAMNLKLTNAITGRTTQAWARGDLNSVLHKYGIPAEHCNIANMHGLKELGLEPDKPFQTLGSSHYGIRISSYG